MYSSHELSLIEPHSITFSHYTTYTGPLFLVAFLYMAIGLALGWVVKQLFWVPHRFRYGIIVAGGWSNWGDIRMFVSTLSIMQSFNAIL
jgi:lipoprotein signal peptidase